MALPTPTNPNIISVKNPFDFRNNLELYCFTEKLLQLKTVVAIEPYYFSSEYNIVDIFDLSSKEVVFATNVNSYTRNELALSFLKMKSLCIKNDTVFNITAKAERSTQTSPSVFNYVSNIKNFTFKGVESYNNVEGYEIIGFKFTFE